MLKPFYTFKGLSMGLPHFWKHGYFKENGYELGIVIGGNNMVPSEKEINNFVKTTLSST